MPYVRPNPHTLAMYDRLLEVLVQLNRHILVLLLIPVAMIGLYPPYASLREAKRKYDRLLAERDKVQGEVNAMNRKIDYLKNHPEYLEVVARDRLQLQKEGEWIIRFEKRFDQ